MAKMDTSKLHLLDQYYSKKNFIRFHRQEPLRDVEHVWMAKVGGNGELTGQV